MVYSASVKLTAEDTYIQQNSLIEKVIIKLLDIRLKQDDFQFNNKIYLKTQECPMEISLSPLHADMFMISLEAKLSSDKFAKKRLKVD